MARTHAKILCSVWGDADFVALPSSAQRTYVVLLTQPKLSLVGLLDYVPSRWARLSGDTTIAQIETDLATLRDARFVVVDDVTGELLIRTFVRHDVATVTKNWKLIKGFWNHWELVQSVGLRSIIAKHVPDEIWEHDGCKPPEEAERLRRSDPIEPETDLQVPSTGSNCGIEPRIDLPTSFLLPPSSFQEMIAPTTVSQDQLLPVPVAVVPPAPRRVDAAFDALCYVTGTEPGGLTKASRGPLNTALADIKRTWNGPPEALPDEIRRRAERYVRQMGKARLTATALAKHWPTLGAASTRLQDPEARKQVVDVDRYADHMTRYLAGERVL